MGQPQHHRLLQAATRAFAELPEHLLPEHLLPEHLPHGCAALVELGHAWAGYIVAFEQARHAPTGTPDLNVALSRLSRAAMNWPPAHDTEPVRQHTRMSRQKPRVVPHGIPWLAQRPTMNTDPIDVYLWIDGQPDDTYQRCAATPDLFLRVDVDPEAVARKHRRGTILQLKVPPATVIDPHDDLAAGDGENLLLPLSAIQEVTVVAASELDGQGSHRTLRPVSTQLHFTFDHAVHGVAGLPNDVVLWPRRGTATTYLLVPFDRKVLTERLRLHPNWLPLFRKRPETTPRFFVARVTLQQHQAIDTNPSIDRLQAIETIRPLLRPFTGLDLVLPRREFTTATITELRSAAGTTPPRHLIGQTLDTMLHAPSQ